MSEARSSIHLSNFFNDDDSEGHLLAQFIKKRKGDGQKQNYLFVNCETERLSFDIQLEPISKPQSKYNAGSEDHIGGKKKDTKVSNKLSQNGKDQELISKSSTNEPIRALKDLNDQLGPNPLLKTDISTYGKISANFSPSDKLRRISIRNCHIKKFNTGRRTLLEEFESTLDDNNFNPLICSTPISEQVKNSIPPTSHNKILPQSVNVGKSVEKNLPLSINNSPQTDIIELNTTNSPITSQSCSGHTNTLIQVLQRKDAELKKLKESILDKTSKDSATESNMVENIEDPEQIILMTENITDDQNINNANLQCSKSRKRSSRESLSRVTKRTRQNSSTADTQKGSGILYQKCSISQGPSKTLQTIHSSKQLQQQTAFQDIEKRNPEIPISSENSNLSIVFPTDNVQEHEDLAENNNRGNSISICAGIEERAAAIPFNQNIIGNNRKENDNIINNQSRLVVDSSASQSKSFQQPEDLKLRDILTDDGEDAPKTTLQSPQNASEIPLNLAPSSSNIPINKKNYQKQSPEERPIVHSRRIQPKRNCKPLNRAPGIPLNGEAFAQELSRMSNYEILDLRKRNSMGKFFVGLGCKKQTLQLNDQIEQELQKRKIKSSSKKSINQLDHVNMTDTRFPPPIDLRDSLESQENCKNISKEVSLIGEKSSDRVKFKENAELKTKAKNIKHSAVLQQYLQVSQKYSKKEGNISKAQLTRRTLFNSEDLCESFQHVSPEKTSSTSNYFGLPYLRSPKTNNYLIEIPKIVSPPPPISTICADPPNCIQINENNNLTLLPTSTACENDAGITSNNDNNQYSTNKTSEVVETITTNAREPNSNNSDIFKTPNMPAPKRKIKKVSTSSSLQKETAEDHRGSVNNVSLRNDAKITSNNDNKQYSSNKTAEVVETITTNAREPNNNNSDIFKKPNMPAPKRKIKKVSTSSSLQKESAEDHQGSVNNVSLRRSKRGQVPRIPDPTIEILYQQVLKKQEKYRKRRQAQILNKVNGKQNKTKIKQKRKQKHTVLPSGNYHCNDLAHNCLSAVDHENYVFDQLKQSSASAITATTAPPRPKIKPFKVRIRRIKSAVAKTIDTSSLRSTNLSSKSNSDHEFLSWLVNVGQTCDINDISLMNESVKEMQIATANKLCFTEMQGVEYAFYNTGINASVGYLRFKPRQVKPKKKPKRFDLHFINLKGKFRITTEKCEHILVIGDNVIVEKLDHYDIENITDDLGILMVIKK